MLDMKVGSCIILLLFLAMVNANQQARLFTPFCSVSTLCMQYTSYSFVNENKSVVFFPDLPTDVKKLCFSYEPFKIQGKINRATNFHCFSSHAAITSAQKPYFFAILTDLLLEGLIDIIVEFWSGDALLQNGGEGSISIQRQLHFFQAIATNSNTHLSNVHGNGEVFMEERVGSLWKHALSISQPAYGTITAYELYLTLTNPFPQQAAVHFHVQGVFNSVYDGTMSFIDSSGMMEMEPSTWFYDIVPIRNNEVYGLPTYGYIEFVLSKENISRHRRFVDHEIEENLQSQAIGLTESFRDHFNDRKYPKMINSAQSKEPMRVCIWMSKGMDGQKTIWLQQLANIDKSSFNFVIIVASTPGETSASNSADARTVYSHLDRLQVNYYESPYNNYSISIDELWEIPADGSPSAAQYLGLHEGRDANLTKVHLYLHNKFLQAGGDISKVTPFWCRKFYQRLLDFLTTLSCELLVYGNSRAFSSDVFLIDVASTLKIPTATELLNLYLDQEILPDLIIAPSEYALHHHSIRSPSEWSSKERGWSPVGVVISPSVDLNYFDPRRFDSEAMRRSLPRPPACSVIERGAGDDAHNQANPNWPCIVIGFVARLDASKNVGLFVQAAYHVLERYPMARFRLIGDGNLRGHLEILANRLGIAWAVEFSGWIHFEDLPRHLAALDIVVNPSLRGWSETFCIANLEAMAMERPLVTFAVGGVGEYIHAPRDVNSTSTGEGKGEGAESESEVKGGWSRSDNAIIVNIADPVVLADAVVFLATHPDEARAIGRRARESLFPHFLLQRQMTQYRNIYNAIRNSRRFATVD